MPGNQAQGEVLGAGGLHGLGGGSDSAAAFADGVGVAGHVEQGQVVGRGGQGRRRGGAPGQLG